MNYTNCDMQTANPLWRIHSFGEEVHSAGGTYWWVNRGRDAPHNVTLQYTLRGTLNYIHNGTQVFVRSGQACLYDHSDGSEYGTQADDESYSCLWVSFKGAGMLEYWDALRARHGTVLDDSEGDLLPLIRQIIQTGRGSVESDPVSSAETVHHFVMCLVRLLDWKTRQINTPVEQAIERLRANAFYPWSIKELVAEAGCSREHFCRVFRKRYAVTPAAWLSSLRTQHACYLLQATQLTAEEIAQQCGFSGAHTLARAMRRIYHLGPRAIRKQQVK